MSDTAQSTLSDYLRTLRRSWRLIAAVTVICAGIAVAYSVLKTPTYEATAQLTVRDPNADVGLIGGQGGASQLPLQTSSAHAPDVTRRAVLLRVQKDLKPRQSLEEIRSLVSVEVDPNSYAVTITAESSDASTAARIANAFAVADARLTTAEARRSYAARARRLEEKIEGLPAAGKSATVATIYANRQSTLDTLSATAEPVQVSAAAQVPTAQASPKPVRNTVAAAVIGLLLGIGLAYGRSTLDRRLRDPSDVEEVLEYPVLARLRSDVFGHTGSLKDVERGGSGRLDPIDGEAFRMLRENLRYLAVDRDLRTIAVTSAIPEEGKSTVAACLAAANAAAGKRTLLVECDLRRRVLAGRFRIPEAPGLSDFLAARGTPADILQLVPVAGVEAAGNGSGPPALVCITAGSAPPRPADMLSSERFADFLEQVGKAYEQVIIDCPAMLPVADTLEIVPHVDCVLMCVRLNHTTREQASAARDGLDRLPPRPVGLVLTGFSARDVGDYRGYYAPDDELAATWGHATRGRARAAAGDAPRPE
jgi:capsular exopolysaccharide synthesis family protein